MDEMLAFSLLKETSRSFYRVFTSIDSDHRQLLCYMYLAFRALDTVEDDPSTVPAQRADNAERFLGDFLENKAFETSIPKYQRLMQNMDWLAGKVGGLRQTQRIIITDALGTMGKGMAKSLRCWPAWMQTDMQLSEYCFTVAGGLVLPLTRLHHDLYPNRTMPDPRYLAAFEKTACLLQMVNIIRDVREDTLEQGRCYWPRSVVCPDADADPDAAGSQQIGDKMITISALNRMIALAMRDIPEWLPVMTEVDASPHLQTTLAMPFPWPALMCMTIPAFVYLARMYDNPDVLQGVYVLSSDDRKCIDCDNDCIRNYMGILVEKAAHIGNCEHADLFRRCRNASTTMNRGWFP
jgi:phytoene/squalene synthetase